MLSELFAVMAPVLIGAGIGYFWKRWGYEYPTDFISRLVFNVASPCLVLATLGHAHIDKHSFRQMALACVIICAIMGLAAYGLARVFKRDWKVLAPAFMFPNVGNMGLPVCLYAFGEQGITLGVAFYLVLSIGNFSLGIFWMSGERSLKMLLGNPIMISVAIALSLMMLDAQLPRWIANTVDLMSGLAIPLMLITLGVSLASIRPQHLGSGFLFGGIRLCLGALVGWLVGWALHLPPLAHAVLVTQSSMPVAVFNYLYALRANRSPQEVASLVLCSTILAFGFLPLMLAWWLPATG